MYIGLHVNYSLCVPDFKELEFSQKIFEKYSNIYFHENSSSEAEFSMWTDKHDEANSRFWQSCERA